MRFPFLTVFFLLCVSYFGYLFYYQPINKEKYHRLMSKISSSTTKEQPVRHQRHGIQKDIFFLNDNQRMQLRIKGVDAELVLNPDIVEIMHDVVCLMQEELYYLLPDGQELVTSPNGKYLIRGADPKKSSTWVVPDESQLKPMQEIRYLEADTATYHYKKELLIADTVNFARYIVPGHQLVETVEGLEPSMTGEAEAVEISLLGKEMSFKAHKLKAKMR